ncbi:NUDIX domain-containing protein, partial [Patescibacteria group bacterium]|nr:NUDIX domain-containing protein [Patescibacteria group bacterium]
MKRKFSAGGIISKIHEGNTFILCLTTKNNLLTLPKGHLEKGETPEQAAIREIKEEIGLRSASITKKLGEIVRVGTEQDGSQSIKKITYFIMDGSEYTYDHEENYVWVGFDMALKLMDHPEEKNLLFDNEESIAKNTSAYFNSYKSFINYYYYPKKTILSENYELLNKVRKFVNSNTVAVVIGIPTKQEKELFSKTHKTLYVSPG